MYLDLSKNIFVFAHHRKDTLTIFQVNKLYLYGTIGWLLTNNLIYSFQSYVIVCLVLQKYVKVPLP